MVVRGTLFAKTNLQKRYFPGHLGLDHVRCAASADHAVEPRAVLRSLRVRKRVFPNKQTVIHITGRRARRVERRGGEGSTGTRGCVGAWLACDAAWKDTARRAVCVS